MKILLFAASLMILVVFGFNVNGQEDKSLYRIRVNDKYGFIDKTGKVVVQPQYERAGEFHEGLAWLMTKEGKYGYIDVSGRFAIEPVLGFAEDFSDGLAVAGVLDLKTGKGTRGYVDKKGKLTIDRRIDQFDYPQPFREGLAVFYKNEKFGYIDKTGRVAIEPRFDIAFGFSEGLAQVRIDRKYGYIDKSGKMVIEPQFPQPQISDIIGRPHPSDHDRPFRNGLTSIGVGEREWSVIDKTGRIVFTPSPGRYAPFLFSEGLLRYAERYNEGFLNPDGSVAVKAIWRTVNDFSEGLAPVEGNGTCPDNMSNCWGYIDKTGTVVIKPQFVSAQGFKGGLAQVTTRRSDPKDGRMFFTAGYIDRTGTFVWSAPAN
jgi:hypothetical protein